MANNSKMWIGIEIIVVVIVAGVFLLSQPKSNGQQTTALTTVSSVYTNSSMNMTGCSQSAVQIVAAENFWGSLVLAAGRIMCQCNKHCD